MKKLILLPMLLTVVSCTTHKVKVDDHSTKYVTNYNTNIQRGNQQDPPSPEYYPVEQPQRVQRTTTINEVSDPVTADLSLIDPSWQRTLPPPQPQRRTYPTYPRGYARNNPMPRIIDGTYPAAPIYYFGN
jgi:hypothetical protein